MNERTDLERTLAAWLSAEAPRGVPGDLLGGVFATTRASGPWPTWRALLSVAPMRTQSRVLAGSQTLRTAGILTALLLLAGLLLVGALAGSAAQQLVDRLPAESPLERPVSDPEPSPARLGDAPRFTVDLEADPTVTWAVESSQDPADTQVYVAWLPGSSGSDGIARLIITRPSTVYEPTTSPLPAGRPAEPPPYPVPVPEDLVAWMSEHPALSVGDVASRSLGGVPAVAFRATAATRDMEPPRRTFLLFPGFLVDSGWSYEIRAVDLGQQGWLVAICEWQGWQDADLPEDDAVAACEKLLGTFRFVGEPTGGAPLFFVGQWSVGLDALPIPIKINIPQVLGGVSDDERLTIEPDLPVPLTGADYFAGRDAAMEAILAYRP